MYPCEEMWIDITANESYPYGDLDIYVEADNAANQSMMSSSWGVSGTLTLQDALPIASGGFPWPGTRDPSSLITKIKVWSAWAPSSYQVSYTLTVHFAPRAGYNRGGLWFEDAFWPLQNGSQIPSSIRPYETDYYRVSLESQGQLTLSGTLTNENWYYGTGVTVSIYDILQQYVGLLLNQSVSANTSQNPNGVTVTFTSNTLTNNGTSPADYFLAISSSGSLHASTMTISANVYQPNCSCQPIYAGGATPWTGTRKVKINGPAESSGFPTLDRVEIEAAIREWNDLLSGLSIPIDFEIVTSAPYDILIYANSNAGSGAKWIEEENPPNTPTNNGHVAILVNPNHVGQGKAGLMRTMLLHELGHALDHKHLDPSVDPGMGSCNARDTGMFHEVNEAGPFPGLTCADVLAIDSVR